MGGITNKEEKKTSFWGASIFKKAKDLFTGEGSDSEDSDVLNDSKNQVGCISYLDYVCKEIVNHVASNELVPILTHQKFHSLCGDKFEVGKWRKVVERHLLKTNRIKYSKATIEFDKGRYHKEYKVIRFINLDKLRGK